MDNKDMLLTRGSPTKRRAGLNGRFIVTRPFPRQKAWHPTLGDFEVWGGFA